MSVERLLQELDRRHQSAEWEKQEGYDYIFLGVCAEIAGGFTDFGLTGAIFGLGMCAIGYGIYKAGAAILEQDHLDYMRLETLIRYQKTHAEGEPNGTEYE